MSTTKSSTEIRLGHRYSIRRDGETAYAGADNIRTARKLQGEANRSVMGGHNIVDNRSGKVVR